jgi:RHS repeat-associated protein
MKTRLDALVGFAILLAARMAGASEWNSQSYDLYPGDFDGNGATDVLYVAKSSGATSGIALSNGVEWVAGAQSWNSDGFGLQWHSNAYLPVIGDFNWDGRDDIFMHRQTPGDHVLMLSQPDGTFTGSSQTIGNSRAGLTWSGDQHRIIAIKGKNGSAKGHRLFLQSVAAGGPNAIVDTSSSAMISASTVGSAWTDGYRGFNWNLRQSLVHSGDFNGDGDGDLLIQAKPQVVMIDFEPAFPIPVTRPGSFGIVYSPVANGVTAIWNRQQAGVDWSATSSNLVIGDFDGDGRDDVIVQAKGGTSAAAQLVLTNSATNQLNLASPVSISFTGAASVSGSSYRILAANINGSPAERAAGIYLQGPTAGSTDLIANSLYAGGGTVATSTQSAQSQVAAHSERPYMTAVRYNLAGQVAGIIYPDPDGSGGLKYRAVRRTFDRGLVTREESGELQSWVNDTVAPHNWEQVTTFTKFVIKEIGYDAHGRVTTQTVRRGDNNAIDSLMQFNYDAKGHVRCRALRMNRDVYASLPTDACLPSTVGTDGPDRISRFTHDQLGNVLTEERGLGSNQQATYVTSVYSGRNLVFQTDANGNKTELRYEGGRLARIVYPSASYANTVNESDYEEFKYYPDGKLKTQRKRSGKIITYTYDDAGRTIAKDYDDNAHSQDVHYTYYPSGDLRTARFGSTSGPGVEYSYDRFGRPEWVKANTAAAASASGESRTMEYSYDDNGNRTRVRHPDGQSFEYVHDGRDRLCGLAEGFDASDPTLCGESNLVVAVDYRNVGSRNTLTRGGVVTTYTSDGMGKPGSLSHQFPGDTHDLTNTFTFNVAGQITELTQSNNQYSYAGNANRTGAYHRNGRNQYTSIAGQTILYDTNGNLVSDATLPYSMTYDMENRLVATTGTAATTGSFKYDPLGRLQQVTINNVTTEFLYDGQMVVAEYTNGSLAHRYVHGNQADEIWIQYNGTAVNAASRNFVYADHQGSVIARSDASGASVTKLSYDSFGIPGSANTGRFGYTGQMWIKELGLFHYKARMYSPILGRFLQTDPAGTADGLNLYAYVGNDPLNFSDPTGKWKVKYARKATNANSAVQAEIARQRALGWTVKNIKYNAQHENDWAYAIGREYDIVAVDQNGVVHLTEVKFRAHSKDGDKRKGYQQRAHNAMKLRGAPRQARMAAQAPGFFQALHMLRQATFDSKADGETMKLTPQGRFGSSWSIQAGHYQIHWVIINVNMEGYGADIDDVEAMAAIFDELISE